jgi:hypothetical protein
MIIHASADFVKHFKCRVSHPGRRVTYQRSTDSWSAHIVNLRGKKLVLVMNDMTLYAMIIPLERMTFDEFVLRFFKRILVEWDLRGMALNETDLSVLVLKRSNRQLIGCMNNAAQHLAVLADRRELKDKWTRIEIILNDTPFALLANKSPDESMDLLIGPMG